MSRQRGFAHPAMAAIYYSNRAAAHMALCKYEAAVSDCTKALELRPRYPKVVVAPVVVCGLRRRRRRRRKKKRA